jgi:hypothetical protein
MEECNEKNIVLNMAELELENDLPLLESDDVRAYLLFRHIIDKWSQPV